MMNAACPAAAAAAPAPSAAPAASRAPRLVAAVARLLVSSLLVIALAAGFGPLPGQEVALARASGVKNV